MASSQDEFVALAELKTITSGFEAERQNVMPNAQNPRLGDEFNRPEWLDRINPNRTTVIADDDPPIAKRPDLRSEDSTPPILFGLDAGQLVLISIVGLAIWGALE